MTDETSYVVEVKRGGIYRTYRYFLTARYGRRQGKFWKSLIFSTRGLVSEDSRCGTAGCNEYRWKTIK